MDSIRERARCNFSGVNLQELHEIISEINIKESNDVDKVQMCIRDRGRRLF